MDIQRFRELTEADGPYATVYLDDSHNTEQAEREIELRWRALRDELLEQGATTAVLELLDGALAARPPAVGNSGRALIATPSAVVVDAPLIRPPVQSVARFSPLPYLIPLIAHGSGAPSYLVAAVDHTGADITVVTDGETLAEETVDPSGHPVHKAAGAESSGYGDPQPRAEEQAARNLREVAERLTELVDTNGPQSVFLIGETSSISDLSTTVPQRVAELLVDLELGARGSGITSEQISAAVETQLLQRRNAELADTASRYEAEIDRPDGLAVEGLSAVCGALRNGEVDTLIIGELNSATVVDGGDVSTIAPSPQNLSELGVSPERTLAADEALPMAALATGAAVVQIDERIAPRDGVAALRRYLPRTSAPAQTV